MRIQSHTVLPFDPARSNPTTRQASSSLPMRSATKPTVLSSQPATSTATFTSLFQTLSRSGGAVTSVTPSASIFAPTTTATVTPPAGVSTPASATALAASSAASTSSPAAAAVPTPGMQALVSAIMSGSFKATYVTNPSQLQETNPAGAATMPNFYYASTQTADQMAQLLGGTVVQRPAFGQDSGWTEPLANFIQLPNGQTFNAAELGYYANSGEVSSSQLTANLTQTINEGSAWSDYYTNGGQQPCFPTGYVGPPISGMTYPAGSIGADGNVINPAMQGINT
jgi:hypothetical protein